MKRPVLKLGKVGNVVWGRNCHGQTCYALVAPTNARTEPQQANRRNFGTSSSTWRHLTDEQRQQWTVAGRKQRTRRRLGPTAPLTGYQYYMRVNAKRARQGLPLLEVPPANPSPRRRQPTPHDKAPLATMALQAPDHTPNLPPSPPSARACTLPTRHQYAAHTLPTRLGFRCSTVATRHQHACNTVAVPLGWPPAARAAPIPLRTP